MENNAPAPIEGTAPLSTSLDTATTPGPAGSGGSIADTKEPAKPESVGDTLRNELAKVRETEAKEAAPKDEKAEDKAKDAKSEKVDGKEPKDDGKGAKPEKVEDQPVKGEKSAAPEKDDATGQDGAEKPSQSEGRKHSEPPARFLPEAAAKWANVPNEVKAEFHRVSQEFEAETSQYRESHENWQKLSKFDQMAKQHNTSIPDALERYTALDGLLHSNPIEGIRQILGTVGITPQQYAEFITKNPQAAQAPVNRAPDPQRPNPEIEALKAKIAEMEAATAIPVVQAFAAKHPDYHALEGKIADILQSGVIDKIYGAGLSPEQKLSEAYRMAGGSSPSRSEPEDPARHSTPADRPVDPAGQKSIRGAPNGGQEPDNDAPETDIKALLRKELRKVV